MNRMAKYSVIADEYYDGTRHPTCANFREASSVIVHSMLGPLLPARILEVGAGRSIAADYLLAGSHRLETLVITDSSEEMLAHSIDLESHGAELIVADARKIPKAEKSIDVLISSLGDPYNDFEFWKEAARLVRPNGHVIFTAPAWEWAMNFRQSEGSNSDEAMFVSKDGVSFVLPSFVYSAPAQIELITAASFAVIECRTVSAKKLSSSLSSKLAIASDADEPIVRGFLARKL